MFVPLASKQGRPLGTAPHMLKLPAIDTQVRFWNLVHVDGMVPDNELNDRSRVRSV